MAISGKRTPDTRNGGKISHETGCGFLTEKCWGGGEMKDVTKVY